MTTADDTATFITRLRELLVVCEHPPHDIELLTDTLVAVDWTPRAILFPQEPPASTFEHACPTWWVPADAMSRRARRCSLPHQHASPHVQLDVDEHYEGGDVRLGHEPHITHVPAWVVRHHIRAVTPLVAHAFTPHIHLISALWSSHLTSTHNHETCGFCPREVW